MTIHLPFTEDDNDGFTVDTIIVSPPVSVVEMGAGVISAVFTNCGTEWNAAVVSNAATEDPTFTVRVVTEGNGTYIVPLGDTIFIIALDDP